MFEKFTQVKGGSAPAGLDIDWVLVEDEIGSKLPSCYKEFVEKVSAGLIHDYLQMYSPVSSDDWLRLSVAVPRVRQMITEMEDPDHFSFQSQLGLGRPGIEFLPIGETIDGDMIILLKLSDDPNQWPVASVHCRDDMGYNLGVNFEQFMQGLVDMVPMGDAFPEGLYDQSGQYLFVPRERA